MAIVDDYAGIAAELRRIRGEHVPQEQPQRPGKAVAVYVTVKRLPVLATRGGTTN